MKTIKDIISSIELFRETHVQWVFALMYHKLDVSQCASLLDASLHLLQILFEVLEVENRLDLHLGQTALRCSLGRTAD